MRIDGSCHCGNITYVADIDPEKVVICHCTDCQALTGTAYRVVVRAPRDKFELRGAKPKIYVKTAESGSRRAQAFCPECGTPVYSAAAEDPKEFGLRVGTIRQRAERRPRQQIWCRSALGWAMDLRSIAQVEKQ